MAQRSDARSALPLDGADLQGDAAACTWSASAAHSGDRGSGLGSSSCPAGCAASEPFPRKVRAETLTCAMLSCYARFPLSVLVCADEVSAIVVDVGHTSCKAGFAGEDNPKAVFPSHVGVVRPGKDGVVGQRPAATGDSMDVDGASAPAGAAAGRCPGAGLNVPAVGRTAGGLDRGDGVEEEFPSAIGGHDPGAKER